MSFNDGVFARQTCEAHRSESWRRQTSFRVGSQPSDGMSLFLNLFPYYRWFASVYNSCPLSFVGPL